MKTYVVEGCIIVLACSLCSASMESSNHLFFYCIFSIQFWALTLPPFTQHFICCDSSGILNMLVRNWSCQVAYVLLSTITHIYGVFGMREILPGSIKKCFLLIV